MFDVTIGCDKRAGYLYYIENSDDMERGGVRQWRVNTFAVNNLINESHKLKSQILFEEIPSGQSYLTQIIEAMRDGVTLRMTYHSFWKEAPTNFLVEPYCVKVFKQRWYMVGRTDAGVRIYSLDRIEILEMSDKTYTVPDDFDGKMFFNDSFGIIASDDYAAEEVQIKAYGIKAKYLKTLPLHHTQKEIAAGEDYSILSYQIKPTYDFRAELLSHGDRLEVLSPQWFRDEIKEIISRQTLKYK